MKFSSVSKESSRLVSGALFFVVIAFGVGFLFGKGADVPLVRSSSTPANVDFDPFWKAWHLLDERFVPATTTQMVTDEEKVWGAIQGLAGSYNDPYTVFLPPADKEMFEEDISGFFGGVGMEVGSRDGRITIISPLKGTPAERAGLLSGDVIVRVDGTVTEGKSVDEVVKLIRGEVGDPVKLTIFREGENELLEVTVVRDVINIPTIETELRADGIFVIELYNFSAVSSNQFRSALREFIESGSDKLILDLRGNPGGFLNAAVEMASWFLPAGKVIVREDHGEEERLHRSRGYDIFNENLKMAVLVDQGSASASEILAGALREHGIATLIGERTFGKGSVQELVPVTNETSLKVTVAQWLTPNGNSISAGGLTPDVEAEFTRENAERGEDPQKEAAVSFLLNQ
ncbi:MAG: S41 family peptidase [Candidatus Paceibacterota bacterium]